MLKNTWPLIAAIMVAVLLIRCTNKENAPSALFVSPKAYQHFRYGDTIPVSIFFPARMSDSVWFNFSYKTTDSTRRYIYQTFLSFHQHIYNTSIVLKSAATTCDTIYIDCMTQPHRPNMAASMGQTHLIICP